MNGPLRSLSRVLAPILVGGEWTWAIAWIIVLQIVAFGAQLVLGDMVLFHALSLGGLAEDGYEPWRFLTFLFVTHPDPAIGAGLLLANLLALGAVAGEAGQVLGNRRFVLVYLLMMLGGSLGGILTVANQEVFGAIGPAAGTIFVFGLMNPARRIYGRIPARVFAFGAMALLVGGHFALLSLGESTSVDDGAPYAPFDAWSFASQATGGVVAAYVYFLARPMVLRRRQVRDMFRSLRDMQEEQALRERVDALLEKITRESFASLSREERRFLRRASRHIQEAKERERAERRNRQRSENSFF